MAINLERTLRKALKELRAERDRFSRQIVAIEKVLAADSPRRRRRKGRAKMRGKPVQKRMSAAARKAVSRRMKAYWAKRRAEASGEKGKAGK